MLSPIGKAEYHGEFYGKHLCAHMGFSGHTKYISNKFNIKFETHFLSCDRLFCITTIKQIIDFQTLKGCKKEISSQFRDVSEKKNADFLAYIRLRI